MEIEIKPELQSFLFNPPNYIIKNSYGSIIWTDYAIAKIVDYLQLDGKARFNTTDLCMEFYEDGEWERVNDELMSYVSQCVLDKINSIKATNISIKNMSTALWNFVVNNYSYSHLEDYIDSLKWDGIDRMDDLLEAMKVDPTNLNFEIMKLTLRASIARVYEPGCKFDQMIILHGSQGTYKSTFIKTLYQWYSEESINDFSGQEATEKLAGAWAWECAELDSFRATRMNALKHFITKTNSTYRKPYKQIAEVQKRVAILWGTTNEDDFLRDSTGERRMWILSVRDKIDIEWIQKNRDQIWAQAKMDYAGLGCKDLYLKDENVLNELNELQNGFKNVSPLCEKIMEDMTIPDSDLRKMIKRKNVGLKVSDIKDIYNSTIGNDKQAQYKIPDDLITAGFKKYKAGKITYYTAPKLPNQNGDSSKAYKEIIKRQEDKKKKMKVIL